MTRQEKTNMLVAWRAGCIANRFVSRRPSKNQETENPQKRLLRKIKPEEKILQQ